MNISPLVLVTGGNPTGSCIANYLHHSGISTVMVLKAGETAIRRNLAYSEAQFTGKKNIDGVNAVLIDQNMLQVNSDEDLAAVWRKAIKFQLDDKALPVFASENFPDFLEQLEPGVIVRTDLDEFDIPLESAPLIIGLHPNHRPQKVCHRVVETRLNFFLGNIFSRNPENLPEFQHHFFKKAFEEIKSPLEGVYMAEKEIGEEIHFNETIGTIANIKIKSPYHGQIWGMLHSGRIAGKNEALARIFMGPASEGYKEFDFRHKVIAGAVLKEVMHFYQQVELLMNSLE